jgi:radical SAM superfamily enzyme YgiQ (UPF0313 family)
MRITLIMSAPPHDALRNKEPFMPLSLPLLAATAPDHEYTLIDMLWHRGGIDYSAPADLVGISVRMTAERYAYEIADEYRRRGVPVVLGGPQVSAVPFRAIDHADAVAVGEGEPLWPVIVEHARAGELRSFYVVRPEPFDGRGRAVHQVAEWPDLSQVPMARRDLFRHRYQFDTVFAARGCPIDCDFCGVPGLYGTRTRLRPVERMVEEIDTFKGFYYLLDDSVFGRPGTYGYYLDLYSRIAGLERKRPWVGQANLGAVSSAEGRDVIRAAAEAGLVYAMVGMESIDPAVLRAAGSLAKTGLADADDVTARMKQQVRFLQDLGIFVSGWFTIGYEQDTLETFHRSLDFCLDAGIMPVLSPLNALPGTRLLQRLEAEGKIDWTATLTNIPHPRMRPDEVIQALDCVVDRGYSLGERLKRTRRLLGSLLKCKRDDFRMVVEKTMFSVILQHEMRQIVQAENRNLESPVSQNAFAGVE